MSTQDVQKCSKQLAASSTDKVEFCSRTVEETTIVNPELPTGTFDVIRERAIIKATIAGRITVAITEDLQRKVEEELMQSGTSCILYDARDMQDPPLTLVFLMEAFHERLNERIERSAIVVPGYRLAYLSRLAFGKNESKYRVFYNDRDEAIAWLQSK